jgi:hypothetical protein
MLSCYCATWRNIIAIRCKSYALPCPSMSGHLAYLYGSYRIPYSGFSVPFGSALAWLQYGHFPPRGAIGVGRQPN